tara:strand:- start:53 stop:547 length:495 start_codon:yes stop_codon:yes gene_type:complete
MLVPYIRKIQKIVDENNEYIYYNEFISIIEEYVEKYSQDYLNEHKIKSSLILSIIIRNDSYDDKYNFIEDNDEKVPLIIIFNIYQNIDNKITFSKDVRYISKKHIHSKKDNEIILRTINVDISKLKEMIYLYKDLENKIICEADFWAAYEINFKFLFYSPKKVN